MEKHTKSSGVKLLEFLIINSPTIADIGVTMMKEAEKEKRISILRIKTLTLGLTYNERKRLNNELRT